MLRCLACESGMQRRAAYLSGARAGSQARDGGGGLVRPMDYSVPSTMERIMHNRNAILLAAALLAASALAQADTDTTMAHNLALYEKYAGAPVEEIRQFRQDGFQMLGERAIGVWSNPGELYLVEVEPCGGLDFARAISISSTQRVVSRRFDHVSFEHQRCRIERIRRVDERAMKKDPAYAKPPRS